MKLNYNSEFIIPRPPSRVATPSLHTGENAGFNFDYFAELNRQATVTDTPKSTSRNEHLKRMNELRRESWRRSNLVPTMTEQRQRPESLVLEATVM